MGKKRDKRARHVERERNARPNLGALVWTLSPSSFLLERERGGLGGASR